VEVHATAVGKKVALVNLGCAKNLVDAEVMLGKLYEQGYELTLDPTQADYLIVNTCGFIQSAKEESIDHILEMAQIKGPRSLSRPELQCKFVLRKSNVRRHASAAAFAL